MSDGKRGRPRKQTVYHDTGSETPYQGTELPSAVLPVEHDESYKKREELAQKLWEREKGEFGAAEESEEVKSDAEEKGTADTEEKEKAEDQRAEPGEEAEPHKTVEAAPDEELDTLVVDGESMKKSKKEIYEAGKRAIQKDLAADKRLEEATRLRKEVMELKAQLDAQLSQKRDTAAKPEPVTDMEFQKKFNELDEIIQYGEEQDRKRARMELHQLFVERHFKEQQERMRRDLAEQELRQMEALRQSLLSMLTRPKENGGYPDIVPKEFGGQCEDDTLWGAYQGAIDKALKSGKPNHPQTYLDAAAEVRQRFIEPKKENTLAERREKKKAIDVVKSVSAKSESSADEEKQEDSIQDIIAEHRKHRGFL